MKRKPIKIIHSRLGRSGAVGLAHIEKRLIELDLRLKGFDYLETTIHEIMHIQNPKWPEITVLARAKEMAELLWALSFRQVDNHKE